ncbi:MAG: hypothetical protein ACE5JO_00645 [Candidatus Binatia bacterium]
MANKKPRIPETVTRQTAFEDPKRLPEGADWPAIPRFRQTYPIRGYYVRLRLAFSNQHSVIST